MKIAILGPGAMGCIYGARLSLQNEVYLIGRDKAKIDKFNKLGIILKNAVHEEKFNPKATIDSTEVGEVDLLIVFVKAPVLEQALEENTALIGENTYVMTLQNGSGHEDVLSKFVMRDKIIIGTTEDSGTIIDIGYVRHGGSGVTNIGMLDGKSDEILNEIATTFNACGFKVKIFQNIHQLIWNKLMINSSLSILTGVLQVKTGYIAQDKYAWSIVEKLCKETITVGTRMGLEFDEQEILKNIKNVSDTNPQGVTSICFDLSKGAKTEVSTISGSVIRKAKEFGIDVPTHELIVTIVQAMENREQYLV